MDVVHRLGTAACVLIAMLCMASGTDGWLRRWRVLRRLDAALPDPLAVAVSPGGRGRPAAGRRAGVVGADGVFGVFGAAGSGRGGRSRWGMTTGRRTAVRGVLRRWTPVAGAMCAGYVLVGGVFGGLLGLLGGCAVWRWQRGAARGPAPVEEFDTERAARELPLAADLLAACIAAGADPVTAARVVGESLAGPVGERLAWGAAELRLGGEPAHAWRRLAALPAAGPLARLLERAGDSGAPAAAPVARLAADARAEWGRSATARARRAAVLVTAPVGLCFLPAFIAVGVLPVVIGLAAGLLHAGAG